MCIDINIQRRSKAKQFFCKIGDKLEDTWFSVVEKLPERLITSKMMNWLDRHLNKKIQQLERQNIENNWKKVYLDRFIDDKGIRR
ncbi:MAG: hypothetical protein NC452_05035 [Eubacterium sp.]|nr:hypothetical protein [Eubacterium sp.]